MVRSAAARVGGEPGLNLEQRRSRFLRKVAPSLGPAQLEHITLHCEHVARTAARLAALMRVAPEQAERVRLVGLLHDIGKSLAPEHLLARPGPLTDRERALLAHHAEQGATLCALMGAPSEITLAIGSHHALPEQGPPIASRIVRVADALVVMTSGRAYSAPRTFTAALAELRRGRGTQFDPDVVVAAHILGASVMALAA
jgi:putative two-component system response regulator